jgi:hypothetical protein
MVVTPRRLHMAYHTIRNLYLEIRGLLVLLNARQIEACISFLYHYHEEQHIAIIYVVCLDGMCTYYVCSTAIS